MEVISKKKITVAVAGNPNSGKSTIFNRLTGERQHIGNYPGVTVDIKEGVRVHEDFEIKFVDLPGTYSLTAMSLEELVARNFIIENKPDLILDIVDATNLERNLYLVLQIIELGVPILLVFNKWDDVIKARTNINHKEISKLLYVKLLLQVAIVPFYI